MIRRRHVFHVAGYDPVGAKSQHRRFQREIGTFTKTWNVAAAVSDLQLSSGGADALWTVETSAANWQVETVCEPMAWDDIVRADLSQPMTLRLAGAIVALIDFVRSGTVARYFRANWKYGVFFAYPYLVATLFAVVACAIGAWTADQFDLAGLASAGIIAFVGMAILLGLLHWPGRRLRVLQGLDDWFFSWAYLHGRRHDLEARLDRFADALIARSRDAGLDEIIVVGHSMGATLAIEVVARALARDPEFARRGPAVCLLTVGSTVAKFVLHPAAERISRAVAAVASHSSVAWVEYQARDDVISFYKFDPVTRSRLGGDRMDGRPMIRRVQFHEMLSAPTFSRNRISYMRLHYQFVMANERRSAYDHFMMICGPIPFLRSALAPGGATEMIALDGTLIDQAEPVPAIAA